MTNQEIFNFLSEREFSGHNFLDLKQEQILNSKIDILYQELGKAVSFRSEDGTLHFYANDDESFLELLNLRIEANEFKSNPRVFLPEKFEAAFTIYLNQYKKQFDFDYYRISKDVLEEKSTENDNLKFRFLSDEISGDQERLNRWYEDYNSEMGTDWDLPSLQMKNRDRFYCMFNAQNQILAYVNFNLESPHRMWFGRFYIVPEFRNKSYAKAMIHNMKKMALQKEKDLSLLVHTDNFKAIALYEREGFVRQERIFVFSKS